jgi:hypothetical protein
MKTSRFNVGDKYGKERKELHDGKGGANPRPRYYRGVMAGEELWKP